MNNTHTPGPWTHNADGLVSAGSIMIADCRMAHAFESVGAKTTAEEVANARLIAAAPDLLSNLQECASALADIINAAGNQQPYSESELESLFASIQCLADEAIARAIGPVRCEHEDYWCCGC